MSEPAHSSEMFPSLISFLEKKSSYPHNPESVEHIQTHISHVFIAPPFVYKIKKPVDFGFLDYSSKAKRKHYCEQEVELNNRLCSDAYLGVVPLYFGGKNFSLENGDTAEVIEHAVKMRKLPEEYFLHSYIKGGELERSHLDRVSDKLAAFYNSQEPGPEILEFGSIEQIRFNTDENFSQTESFVGRTLDELTFKTIKHFTDRYFRVHEALFNSRLAEKRIVDGHGDLHLEHIHITPDSVCIYDCIEFNERFRYGDLAADLAFLAMDLDFHGCRNEERYFVDQMAEKVRDDTLSRIIEFYKCYRAYVKGKVKSLQSEEEEVPEEQRNRSVRAADRYFRLALKYALIGSRPIVLVFMGRIAAGKSTLASSLADKIGISCFSSDRIRKEMAGQEVTKRTPVSIRKELYSAGMSQKTYRKLREHSKMKLDKSESVIIDATFSRREARKELTDMLEERNVPYLFIEAVAPDELIKERLGRRDDSENVVSDARLEDFEMLDRNYEPPTEIDPTLLLQIDTGISLDDSLAKLYHQLTEYHLLKQD